MPSHTTPSHIVIQSHRRCRRIIAGNLAAAFHFWVEWRRKLNEVMMLLIALGWAGLSWAKLGWAGLGWAELGWAGLGWAGLGWTELDWAGQG